MKTAVIYARYSSDRQTEQSIEGQVRVCNDYAERNGILIVNQYIDRATTGTNDNRDAFQQMLKDSDKKQFDFVLVYKLDRFSRNKFEMAMHRKGIIQTEQIFVQVIINDTIAINIYSNITTAAEQVNENIYMLREQRQYLR